METNEEKRARWKAAMQKDQKWDPVRAAIFAQPEPHPCPFCGKGSLSVGWSLYHDNPRLASVDIRCGNCGEWHHCAAALPAEAPDSYPPRSTGGVGDLTKKVYERGRQQGWW